MRKPGADWPGDEGGFQGADVPDATNVLRSLGLLVKSAYKTRLGYAAALHRSDGGLPIIGRVVRGWALTWENWPVDVVGSECMARRVAPNKVLGLFALPVLGAIVIFNHTPGMFKVCLFSPVKGKVVFKGQPVVGAVIERRCTWNWKKTEQADQTTTDVNGEFSLPAIHGTMILGQVAPHEPYIDQLINIRHEGADYLAWATDKRNYEEFGELAGLLGQRPIELFCDLNVEPKNHDFRLKGQYGGLAELRNVQSK